MSDHKEEDKTKMEKPKGLTRRDFLKIGAKAAVGGAAFYAGLIPHRNVEAQEVEPNFAGIEVGGIGIKPYRFSIEDSTKALESEAFSPVRSSIINARPAIEAEIDRLGIHVNEYVTVVQGELPIGVSQVANETNPTPAPTPTAPVEGQSFVSVLGSFEGGGILVSPMQDGRLIVANYANEDFLKLLQDRTDNSQLYVVPMEGMLAVTDRGEGDWMKAFGVLKTSEVGQTAIDWRAGDQNRINLENYNGVRPQPDDNRISLDESVQYITDEKATSGQLIATDKNGKQKQFEMLTGGFFDDIGVTEMPTHKSVVVYGTFVRELGTRLIQNVETVNTATGQKVDILSWNQIGVVDMEMAVKIDGKQVNLIFTIPKEQVYSNNFGGQPQPVDSERVLALHKPGVKTSISLILPNNSWEEFMKVAIDISGQRELPVRQIFALDNLMTEQYLNNIRALVDRQAEGTIYVGPTHELNVKAQA